MRESAAAALLSSLISQHGAQKQPYIPSGLQEAMGIKETLSRIQPQSKEGERAVFAAATFQSPQHALNHPQNKIYSLV